MTTDGNDTTVASVNMTMDTCRLYLNGPPRADAILPIQTKISLFVLNYCRCQELPISLDILPGGENEMLMGQKVEVCPALPSGASNCKLPALLEGNLVRAGLCTVLRHIVKSSHHKSPDMGLNHLLGYKGICLKACAEVSVWTKFCEVEMPKLIDSLQFLPLAIEEIPEEILKLENHMREPPIIPNITKRKRQAIKQSNNECLEHVFAEGTDMTLTDLILLPCVSIFLAQRVEMWVTLSKQIPLVFKWYQRMLNLSPVKEAIQRSGLVANELPTSPHENIPQKIVPHLNVRDSSKKKNRVHPSEVANTMESLNGQGITPSVDCHPCADNLRLNWEGLPSAVHPVEGDLPTSRVTRKCEQLENLAAAVNHIAQDGLTIVDFCSGGGHLGILLSHLLPQCQIVLVENKEESLERGRKRVEQLGLNNITLYQCNMDYYTGHFDVGVCLHACGVATDLVLQRCLEMRASFVICPCCYGSIQDTHTMTYPRSRCFKERTIKYSDYLVLTHAADQTEFGINQASIGKECMLLIDRDRALVAEEAGYDVTLCSLDPITCSPKNNLLIGKPRSPKRIDHKSDHK